MSESFIYQTNCMETQKIEKDLFDAEMKILRQEDKREQMFLKIEFLTTTAELLNELDTLKRKIDIIRRPLITEILGVEYGH